MHKFKDFEIGTLLHYNVREMYQGWNPGEVYKLHMEAWDSGPTESTDSTRGSLPDSVLITIVTSNMEDVII